MIDPPGQIPQGACDCHMLLDQRAPDERVRKRILVDNAAAACGF